MGITQAINLFNREHFLVVTSVVFQPESRRKTFSKLLKGILQCETSFCWSSFCLFFTFRSPKIIGGHLAVSLCLVSFLMHIHNHTRISSLQCILEVCRAECDLQVWKWQFVKTRLFFMTKNCFQYFFQVKKIWHLFNILFQYLQNEMLCFFISEILSFWNVTTVKSKILNEKDQHLKVSISTALKLYLLGRGVVCLFVSFWSLWGSWVLSQFGRGIKNIPKLRKWENSFLLYSNMKSTSAFKYGDKWVLCDDLPHLVISWPLCNYTVGIYIWTASCEIQLRYWSFFLTHYITNVCLIN